MLDRFVSRLNRNGLSLRTVADEMGVSHTLLSLVLSGRRRPSPRLLSRMERWMATPLAVAADPDPACALRRFLGDRAPALAEGTVRFYRQKLSPFVLWCETGQYHDVTSITPSDVSAFLSDIRKGRRQIRGRRLQLSRGGLKLHHQALMTFFKFVSRAYDLPEGLTRP